MHINITHLMKNNYFPKNFSERSDIVFHLCESLVSLTEGSWFLTSICVCSVYCFVTHYVLKRNESEKGRDWISYHKCFHPCGFTDSSSLKTTVLEEAGIFCYIHRVSFTLTPPFLEADTPKNIFTIFHWLYSIPQKAHDPFTK